MSLRAPIAIPVEIMGPGKRVFRLAASVGTDGIALERPIPFETGRPVEVRFTLPDDPGAETLRAVVQRGGDDASAGTEGDARDHARDQGRDRGGEEAGSELRFIDPPAGTRLRIAHYVASRLGLPSPPVAS